MKEIWIWNHYATEMFFEQGGRHHWFAKYLMRKGYNVKIFCASTMHSNDPDIELEGKLYKEDVSEGIDYVFVKARPYNGNGISRILNMIYFYQNVQKAAKQIAKCDGTPDVVLASSVHPLTLVAGIRFGKKYRLPCICEVRDLWPESIVTYSDRFSKSCLIIRLLYQGEKWIYEHANALIFTMEGGKDYIIDQGWDEASGGKIDLDKVHYINNGVDLESFYDNLHQYDFADSDLDNSSLFKVVYTGSLRKANSSVPRLLDLARFLDQMPNDICILIYGAGPLETILAEAIDKEGLTNVKLEGRVDKKYIPRILSKCDLNIVNIYLSEDMTSSLNTIMKYGGSQNKLFEYLASGHPLILTEEKKYSIVEKNNVGINGPFDSIQDVANYIINIKTGNIKFSDISKVGENYDYRLLSEKLISIIESIKN